MKIEKIEGSFQPTPDGKAAVADNGMVATAFPDATQAGIEMLQKGGNAIDAACAAAMALGVCEPSASGIGGQSMVILHHHGQTITIDGSTRVPSLAHIDRFEKGERFVGYRATTVPSTVAVMGYLNFRYGRLDWSTVLEPAIRIAKDGYTITKLQHDLQDRELKNFLKTPSQSGARYFLKEGKTPYGAGELFQQPDLARTLEHLAEHGARSFYTGKIAKQIDEDMRAHDGFLRADDLALIPWPIERPPLKRRYRDVSVLTSPPPAAGRTLLLVLLMLSHLPTKFIRSGSKESHHFIAETLRKAFLQRRGRPFDPNTYPQEPNKKMLSQKFAKEQATSIHEAIDPGLPLIEPPAEGDDTTHLSVMDNAGNAIGITQSVELVYGSKAAAEGLGFIYNNYMNALETENPAHPHYLRPNAIPWTSVAPAIIFHRDQPWMTVGSPGSERIFSTVSQFLMHMVDGRASMAEAMLRPRFHCSMGGTISIEADRFDPAIVQHLADTGYKIDRREPYAFYLGAIHAVLKCQTQKGFQGVAEIRRDGTAGAVMQTFPVLLSIPHGGTSLPVELQGRVCLDQHGIHDDIDPFVREIYDLGDRVVEVISTDIARTFVDLNRAPDDVPPGNPDGVVKSMTCVSQPIYTSGKELDAGLTAVLLEKYYTPYHAQVTQAVHNPALALGLDCHSMLAIGPDIAPDTGKKRPMICVGNVRGQSCPTDMAERFADCLRHAFALDQHAVTLNQPFAGGYITRTYGGNPIPWLQIEMNRALYLDPRWFERQTLSINTARLQELNGQFAAALERFFASV